MAVEGIWFKPLGWIAIGVSLIGVVTSATVTAAQSQSDLVREISNVSGDLYLVRDGSQFTVFLVTPDGIILADPLHLTTARWLRDQLAMRFPDRPVKYVLHTSHDFERAAGAEVFKPAEIIAHENFVSEVKRAYASLPPTYANIDRNENGILERTEFEGTPAEAIFAPRDHDGNGNVTRQELYGFIATGLVTSAYAGSRTISLGAREVELLHPGGAPAADMSVLYFPAERVLFAANLVAIRSLPEVVGPFHLREYIDTLRNVEALEFDTLITGRGERGTRTDVIEFRNYLEELLAGVRAGREDGLTAEQLQASLRLNNYAGWANYGTRRAANIAEAYALLRELRTSIYGAPVRAYSKRGALLGYPCGLRNYQCVAPGGTASGAMIGFLVSSRRLAASGEVMFGASFNGFHRFVPIPSGWDFDHRDTVVSFLLRFNSVQTSRVIVSAGVGPSIVASETRAVPQGTASMVNTDLLVSQQRFGITAGTDIRFRLRRGLEVFVPLRIARTPRNHDQAAFGLSGVHVSIGGGALTDVGRQIR